MLSGLGINWYGLLGQIISFTVLLVLLYIFAYKPIRRMLDERSQRIKDSMDQAEAIREQSARTDEEVKARLEEARKEGQATVTQAVAIGERLKEETRQEAHREAEIFIDRARTEIQMERDQAIDQLRKEFVDLAILAAEKVINESLDKAAHQRLIEEVLEQSDMLRKS